MGSHIIFIIFHVVAWFTIKYILILTVGLHIIYATVFRNLEKQTELLKEQTRVMKGEEPEPEPEAIPLTPVKWLYKNVIWILLFGTIFAMVVYYLISY
tara:strand:- start:2148 stop:2441 length:294 start_codon:yes stop_codon:yes gene_type:complete